jgi:hypothetical protein
MFNVKVIFIVLVLLVLIPLCFTPIVAQSTSAILSGTVQDEHAAIVPGANVTVVNNGTGARRTATTNGDGYFVIPLLPPSTYTVTVESKGFATVEVRDVVLNVGDQKSFQVQLKVGAIGAEVLVTPEASMVSTSPAVSTVVDRQFAANTPLNGRSFQSLITLAPGVVTVPSNGPGVGGEFSVNGQRTEANYFTVDGVSANTGVTAQGPGGGASGFSGSTPGETVLGTTQSLISVDALQEFRIQTSTYSAEFGRTPGAQISLTSRSGTNDFHGSAFDYVRNEAFDANNWFNNANGFGKTPERQNDFGGTFGGPVIIPRIYDGRNRTFFFFSYEGLRLMIPGAAYPNLVPSMTLRRDAPAALQPILNAFPVPNGPDQGDGSAIYTAAFSNPSRLDATSLRVDHHISDKVSIFGRYSDSPSTQTGGGEAQLINSGFNVKSLTLGMTNIFSPRLTNDLRVNYTRNTGSFDYTLSTLGGAKPFDPAQVFGPLPAHHNVSVYLDWANAGIELQNQETAQRQLNVTDTLGATFGSHTLKFGFDYRRVATLIGLTELGESFDFSDQTAVLQNNAFAIPFSTAAPGPATPIYKNFSAFAQDEWRVNRSLTLSLGLRWEVNPAPGEAKGRLPYTLNQITDLSTAQLAPQGTPLWKTTYGNFAPRFGAAYLLRRAAGRETVLRGGFGVFYDLGNNTGSEGFGPSALGFTTYNIFPNASIPLSAAQLTLPPPSVAAPYQGEVYAFDPHLRLPYTLEWNVAVEQSLGQKQTLTLSYVGAAARRLLVSQYFDPSQLGNPSFSLGHGVILATNRATSDYHALQAQFQRRLSRGLQALISYTWSHAIDEASSNVFDYQLLRGNADFDLRHNFQAAVTYDIPGTYSSRLASALLRHWSLDGRFSARSGLPFDIVSNRTFAPTGDFVKIRPDLVPGVPVYLSDPTAPGGRVVNFAAFARPPAGQFGNEPRNFLRGFGAWQVDMALRREFPVGERLKFQFRAEAFNILNHPNFGTIFNTLCCQDIFGRALNTLNRSGNGLSELYQTGGPRSLQFALKILF